MRYSKDITAVHACNLPEDHGGLAKLPPNAAPLQKLVRWFRKCLAPDCSLEITKRNFRNRSQMNAETRRHATGKYFYIIHPYSKMEIYREMLFILTSYWYVIILPVRTSFEWVYTTRPTLLNFHLVDFSLPNRIFAALQFVWIASCFFAGFKVQYGKFPVEVNQWKIAKRYITSYFLVDVVVVLITLLDRFLSFPTRFWLILMVAFRSLTCIGYYKRCMQDFKRGDPLDYTLFISFGTVAVYNKNRFELIHLTDGDEVGIRAVTKAGQRFYTYTYIAIETTEVYMIKVSDLRDIIFAKQDVLKFFLRKVEERAALWERIESVATAQGTDLLSELKHEKVLEHPRVRTRWFDNK